MRTLRLSTVGAVCAIGTVVCFVVGAVAMGSNGVGVVIPETGRPGLEWTADVDAAGGLFLAGAWLVILMGFLGIVALVGFYDALRGPGWS
ncbi:MAG TPA: hypothetical protein VIQ02_08060 [Jiangellaceae bacterium]|jgi:hypothetical protein